MKKLGSIEKESFHCHKCNTSPSYSGYWIEIVPGSKVKWCNECVRKYFTPENERQREAQVTQQPAARTRRTGRPRQRVQEPQQPVTETGRTSSPGRRRQSISLPWRIIYIILTITLIINIIRNCILS